LVHIFLLRRCIAFRSYSHTSFTSSLFLIHSPQDFLNFWHILIKKYWTHKHPNKSGRPPIRQSIKIIILRLKLDNPFWGSRRIRDELAKIGFSVCHETICNIINNYRKTGVIKPNGSWKRFLTAHWNSLFACDFFTVDCFGFIRLYVFFIIQLNSRRIVHWNITSNPTINFLRLQFSEFEYNFPDSYLIHDNSGELRNFPYDQYHFNHVATSPYSPNMNAFAERFIRSVRQECLNHFIVFSHTHLRNLMREYVHYYNNFRPHQGLHGIPNAPTTTEPPDISAKIKKISVLFGLHHHYYRASA
jgi:transposase InsO family protein